MEVVSPALRAPRTVDHTVVGLSNREHTHPAGQPRHADGCRARGRGPVAELPRRVGAPALHAAPRGERTGMKVARRHRNHSALQGRHVHRQRARRRRSVTKLPDAVVPPALHSSRAGERTRMRVPRGHRHDAAAQPSHVDRHGGTLRRRAVPELAGTVFPPALHAARRGERARMSAAGRHGSGPARQPSHIHRRTAPNRGANSELAGRVFAPARHGPQVRHRTRVVAAGFHLDHSARQTRHVHRRRARPLRSGAELSGAVVAPALHGSRTGQGTGVSAPGCDVVHSARQPRHVHRRPVVGGRRVAELPVEVTSPALDAARAGDRTTVGGAGGHRRHPARQPDHIDRRRSSTSSCYCRAGPSR